MKLGGFVVLVASLILIVGITVSQRPSQKKVVMSQPETTPQGQEDIEIAISKSIPASSARSQENIFKLERSTCPDPFIFDLPIDINKVTSILYPGQIRGGDFKAHGGFRFDNSHPEEITITAPIDAPVVVGARYPVNGVIQYTMEFEHPCGVRYRLGHILTLAPKFQVLAETLPLPQTLDSRTNAVTRTEVKKGEVIATAVGLPGNTFLDWGVYDYRQENGASKDPVWAASHTSDTYRYGVCWFDWISLDNKARVLNLPSSDGTSGKQSDFCK